jgi:hypothetical protein
MNAATNDLPRQMRSPADRRAFGLARRRGFLVCSSLRKTKLPRCWSLWCRDRGLHCVALFAGGHVNVLCHEPLGRSKRQELLAVLAGALSDSRPHIDPDGLFYYVRARPGPAAEFVASYAAEVLFGPGREGPR